MLLAQHYIYTIIIILLLNKVILFLYSCYIKKELIYIAIVAPFSRQPSLYFKCTKLNIKLSYKGIMKSASAPPRGGAQEPSSYY